MTSHHRRIGTVAVLALLGLLGLTACQAKHPLASKPSAQAHATASPAAVLSEIDLPAQLIGLPRLDSSQDPNGTPDRGMSVSLRAVFPQARSVAGAAFQSEQGYALIVGVAVTDTSDAKAAIDKAFASMAARQGRPSVGLAMPTAHPAAAGALGKTVLCGPASAGHTEFPVCAWAADGLVGLVVYLGDNDPKYVEDRISKIRTEIMGAVH